MKIAVYHGSREIYRDMLSAIKSMLAHTKLDKVYLLIEDDVFPYELPDVVDVKNVRDIIPQYFDPTGPNYRSEWTPIGLTRVLLTKILPPDIGKVLSIDADTIVMQDVGDLWNIPLDGYYFAGAKEPVLSGQTGLLYTNAGVTMLNLKKLREDGKDDEVIRMLNEKCFFFVGQDVMNALCAGHVLEIPSDYNASDYTMPTSNKKIIHYAGNRKWRDNDLARHYRDMPWE